MSTNYYLYFFFSHLIGDRLISLSTITHLSRIPFNGIFFPIHINTWMEPKNTCLRDPNSFHLNQQIGKANQFWNNWSLTTKMKFIRDPNQNVLYFKILKTYLTNVYWSRWEGIGSLKYIVLDLIPRFMCMEKILLGGIPT